MRTLRKPLLFALASAGVTALAIWGWLPYRPAPSAASPALAPTSRVSNENGLTVVTLDDGAAFGVFNLITAVALLLASLVAGALWDAAGLQGTFLAGAGFSATTVAGLLSIRDRLKEPEDA